MQGVTALRKLLEFQFTSGLQTIIGLCSSFSVEVDDLFLDVLSHSNIIA